jgi:hypothetical protein
MWFLAWLILRPLRRWRLFPSKRQLIFNELDGVIALKIEIFSYFRVHGLKFTSRAICFQSLYVTPHIVTNVERCGLLTFVPS